jgi:hypothetical protein
MELHNNLTDSGAVTPNGTLPPPTIVTDDARFYMRAMAGWVEFFAILCYCSLGLNVLQALQMVFGWLTGGTIREAYSNQYVGSNTDSLVGIFVIIFSICAMWLNYYLAQHLHKASTNLKAVANNYDAFGASCFEEAMMHMYRFWQVSGIIVVIILLLFITVLLVTFSHSHSHL